MKKVKPVLTAEDLSARWGGSPTPETLHKWRFKGIGPKFFHTGEGKRGRVLYRIEDVEEWERERAQQ